MSALPQTARRSLPTPREPPPGTYSVGRAAFGWIRPGQGLHACAICIPACHYSVARLPCSCFRSAGRRGLTAHSFIRSRTRRSRVRRAAGALRAVGCRVRLIVAVQAGARVTAWSQAGMPRLDWRRCGRPWHGTGGAHCAALHCTAVGSASRCHGVCACCFQGRTWQAQMGPRRLCLA